LNQFFQARAPGPEGPGIRADEPAKGPEAEGAMPVGAPAARPPDRDGPTPMDEPPTKRAKAMWTRRDLVVPAGKHHAGESVIEFRREEDGVLVRLPETLGNKRFVVKDILTAGGQGALIKALDQNLCGRPVLIKLIRIEHTKLFRDVDRPVPNIGREIRQRRKQLELETKMLLRLNRSIDDRIPVVSQLVRDYSAQLHGPHGAEGWHWENDDEDFREEYRELLEREPYLVLRNIDGESLIDLIDPAHARDPRTSMEHAKSVIDFGRHICIILAQFHRRELDVGDDGAEVRRYYVYQDLKPDNIIRTASGELFLIDFGTVATVRVEGDAEEFEGRPEGTSGYCAPETLLPPYPVSEMSDIYSVGATLYHFITGERPPRHGLADAVERARGELSPILYGRLFDLVASCVIGDPEERRRAIETSLPRRPDPAWDSSLIITLRRNFIAMQQEI
jgi:serine/threonine protein kinase